MDPKKPQALTPEEKDPAGAATPTPTQEELDAVRRRQAPEPPAGQDRAHAPTDPAYKTGSGAA